MIFFGFEKYSNNKIQKTQVEAACTYRQLGIVIYNMRFCIGRLSLAEAKPCLVLADAKIGLSRPQLYKNWEKNEKPLVKRQYIITIWIK